MFFFFLFSQSTNIENRVQIRLILYSSQPIILQIFFRVSDNTENLLFLVLQNFVELFMSNIYLTSHNPEKGSNTLWEFKFHQIDFQTFISDSLDFLEEACENIMHKKKLYISNKM